MAQTKRNVVLNARHDKKKQRESIAKVIGEIAEISFVGGDYKTTLSCLDKWIDLFGLKVKAVDEPRLEEQEKIKKIEKQLSDLSPEELQNKLKRVK